MSINACAINEISINALCGRRRSAIIEVLTRAFGQESGRISQKLLQPQTYIRRRPVEDDDEVVLPIEQMMMRVTVDINGQSFGQTIERSNFKPLISVYGLTSSIDSREQVNILDLQIRTL